MSFFCLSTQEIQMNMWLFLIRPILLGIVFNSFFSSDINAQSPYRLNYKKDISALSTGAILWGGGVYLRRHDAKLTIDEIERLDRNDLRSFRRWVVDNDSRTAEKWSDHLKNTAQFVPLILMTEKQPREDVGKVAVMYLETTLLTRGLTSMTKYLRNRTRPFVYNENIPSDEKTNVAARQSFFSGHTSKTAAMCFFTAKVYADYHPESKWNTVVWSAAALVPAATGYFRVKAGRHFPSDVIVGYIVGGSIGYFVPFFHEEKRQKDKFSGWEIRGGLNGVWAGYQF